MRRCEADPHEAVVEVVVVGAPAEGNFSRLRTTKDVSRIGTAIRSIGATSAICSRLQHAFHGHEREQEPECERAGRL